MSEGSILDEAARITADDRQADYGHPFDNWDLIARLCAPVLGIPVTAEQMALCMVQVKVARELHRHKADNLVDIAGYARVVDEIANERQRRAAL